MNKRGQGLSVNAIILIVLGVFVLAILILGFTVGWAKIAPWISTDNVGTIVNSCAVASNTQSVYDFCTSERELKANGVKLKDVTCYTLANADGLSKYGVEKAPSINCKSSVICSEWKYNNNGNANFPVKINGNDPSDEYCKTNSQ